MPECIPWIKNLRKLVHILKYISISFPGLERSVQRREGRSPHLFASYELLGKTGGVHRRCIYSSNPHPHGVWKGCKCLYPKGFLLGNGGLFKVSNSRHPGTFYIICCKGKGCLLFKKDLCKAYRQITVDFPGLSLERSLFHGQNANYGFAKRLFVLPESNWRDKIYLSLKCCDIVNYIDDFAGAEYPELALKAYCILDKVLKSCGLLESVSKSVAPSCCMSFLGVLLNTLSMTLEVTQDRLKESY